MHPAGQQWHAAEVRGLCGFDLGHPTVRSRTRRRRSALLDKPAVAPGGKWHPSSEALWK